MSEKRHEALSALVDGELAEDAGTLVVDQMLADQSLRQRWATYHLIGDVMRKHLLDDQTFGAAGPAPDTPNALSGQSGARRSFRPLAALALAASLAVVAVLGIYSVSHPGDEAVVTAVSQSATDAAAGAAQTTAMSAANNPAQSATVVRLGREVIAGGALGIDTTRMTWNDSAPALARRLNGYLVTHNEFIPNGMRGMLPYAHIVAYEDRN